MEGLPSGTVTFVFTDIEGSTGLLKQLGDAYADVLSEHRRIVRETFARLDGVEIDTQGDAFFFAFARARDAVEAAVEAQRAHATAVWPNDTIVRVRMGLHGRAGAQQQGYLGLTLRRADLPWPKAATFLLRSDEGACRSSLPTGLHRPAAPMDIDRPSRSRSYDRKASTRRR
jgi:hypothetical protein